ncbi:hypothetical protein AGRA3207_000177 [Actinomadura graeca]|uniref:Scaffolding protein n=1 Tax=Actinomadura graeca TaxID=2750812 RepID=A0ABX8QLR4_9ACTN|nr:hypothetical protein [Actinomadura graeca]QXJ19615.1 hypothetical protein AGRA3207_000177 [Actinomadura graeca]
MTDPTPAPAPPVPAPPANPPADPSGSGDPPEPAPPEGDDRAAEVAKLRRENAAWRTKLRAAEERLAGLESEQQSDTERALTTARAEAIRETTEKFRARLVAAEVRGIAAELRFRDPNDAGRLVDLDDIETGPDGEIDPDALRAALGKVVKAKPYLVDTEPPAPTAREAGLGVAGGGPSGDFDGYSVTDFDKEFYGGA